MLSYPYLETWEFTSERPIRSIFSLWPVYGLPMWILKWLWTQTGTGMVPPHIIYYALRVQMLIASLVFEDWALHKLVQSTRQQRLTTILVASSYVTWTYQAHTFSNSVETMLVAWSMVMIQELTSDMVISIKYSLIKKLKFAKSQSSLVPSVILGFLVAFGVFNRITFPTFLFLPGLYLIPAFIKKYAL